jgi:hypothetical protein
MLESLEIKPKEGFGEIKFGEYLDNIVTLLGEAEEIDTIEEDEEMNMLILHYWELGFSIIFEGSTKQIVSGFETDHPDATMFGKKVIGMPEKEVIALMKENGVVNFEAEQEEVDKRVSYDDEMLDFYFRDDKLVYVNWGVYVNEEGEIEDF